MYSLRACTNWLQRLILVTSCCSLLAVSTQVQALQRIEPEWWSDKPPVPVELSDEQVLIRHAELAAMAQESARVSAQDSLPYLAAAVAQRDIAALLQSPVVGADAYRELLGKAMLRLGSLGSEISATRLRAAQRALSTGDSGPAAKVLGEVAKTTDPKLRAETDFQLGLLHAVNYNYLGAHERLGAAADAVPLASVYQHFAGEMAYRLGRSGDAVHYFRRALKAVQRFGRGARTLKHRHNLALALLADKHMGEAIEHFRELAQAYARTPQRYAALLIDIELRLAATVEAQGLRSQAITHLRAAHALLSEHRPEAPRELLEVLERGALLMDLNADLTSADDWYGQAFELRQQFFADEIAALAEHLEALATQYREQGDHDRAVRFLTRSLAIREEHSAPEETRRLLLSLASLLESQEKYAEAERVYIRAEALGGEALSVNAVDGRVALIEFYRTQQRYAEAIPLLEVRLASARERYGAGHAILAKRYGELAAFRMANGDFAAAERDYRRALAIAEAEFGREDPEILVYTFNIANIDFVNGNYDVAREQYERILRVRRTVPDDRFPELQTIQQAYDTLLAVIESETES